MQYDSSATSNPSINNLATESIRGDGMGGGVGGMVYSVRNGQIEVSHSNHRGDVIARTGPYGNTVWSAAYQAYGSRFMELGATYDRQRGNTKDEEERLDLLNQGMRWEDIVHGVWLSRDPAGFIDGPNLYCYVLCNPITKIDPDGLQSQNRVPLRDGPTHQQTQVASQLRRTAEQRLTNAIQNGDANSPQYAAAQRSLAENTGPVILPGGNSASARQSRVNYNIRTARNMREAAQQVPKAGTPEFKFPENMPKNDNPLSASAAIETAINGGKTSQTAPKTQTFRHYGYADDAAKFEGGLRPGSYATHARGRPMHGTTAQQKLALPHDAPPNAYYKVRVGPDVPVNGSGPVQPTQVPVRPGGGIEYTFPQGTPPGSIEGPFLIP